MRQALAILAVSLAVTNGANAASDAAMTGAEFLDACTRTEASWIGFCHGYIQGAFDGLDNVADDACPPPGTSRTRIAEDVVAALRSEPSLLDRSAATLVYAYLVANYPC